MAVQREQVRSGSQQGTSFLKYCCPECAAPMVEVDRFSEYSGVYIWHRCSRVGCQGSWLQKIEKQRKRRQD